MQILFFFLTTGSDILRVVFSILTMEGNDMGMIFMSSVLVSLGTLTTIWKLSPFWLELTLGYDGFVDLVVSLGMSMMFAMSPSFIALMVGSTTGLVFGLVLIVAKKTQGYRKVDRIYFSNMRPKMDSTHYDATHSYEDIVIMCSSFVGESVKVISSSVWKSFKSKKVGVTP